jgi:hypothetical protein
VIDLEFAYPNRCLLTRCLLTRCLLTRCLFVLLASHSATVERDYVKSMFDRLKQEVEARQAGQQLLAMTACAFRESLADGLAQV